MNHPNVGPQSRPSMAGQDEAPKSRRRQAILVLGMHRSGTSALGGAINMLGAAAPKTLMSPGHDNPRGFYESAALATAHDELLASAGSSWSDWRPLDPRWVNSTIAEQHRQRIAALLVDEFGDAPLIFIKDPRICRFVPFMLRILDQSNVDQVAFLPIRSPLEVAYSLERRNGFAVSKSLLLWLRHVLDAEFHSRHVPRYFLRYESFLTDWRYHIDRGSQKTGIVWPAQPARSDTGISQFLTLDLHHERVSAEAIADHPAVAPLVRETYKILTDFADSGEDEGLRDRLDAIRAEFDNGCHMFGSAVAVEEPEVERLRREHHALTIKAEQFEREKSDLAFVSEQRLAETHRLSAERDSLAAANKNMTDDRNSLAAFHSALLARCDALAATRDALAATRDDLLAERDAMRTSRSWRLTAPLRSVGRFFGRS